MGLLCLVGTGIQPCLVAKTIADRRLQPSHSKQVPDRPEGLSQSVRDILGPSSHQIFQKGPMLKMEQLNDEHIERILDALNTGRQLVIERNVDEGLLYIDLARELIERGSK